MKKRLLLSVYGRISRIGLAVSEDGIHFKNFKAPVISKDLFHEMTGQYAAGTTFK